jgi:large subunit ribosomal protein L4
MAVTLDVRDTAGTATRQVTLDGGMFGIEPNVAVLHQVVTGQLAAARAGTQSTKTRAEVSGGGRKPFKQKGTGRARQGSERAPQFTGGGIALGPKPRSYRQRTPRKMIQLALRSALSDRASEGKIVVVSSWPWETPSTKEARAALTSLGLTGKVLIVLDRDDVEAYKSFRNLPAVQLLLAGELNAYDILCNDWIVFTRGTLPGAGEAGAGAEVETGPAETSPVETSPVETAAVASLESEEPAAPQAGEPEAGEPEAGKPEAGKPEAGEPADGEPEAEEEVGDE